jgi:hypothetical protein
MDIDSNTNGQRQGEQIRVRGEEFTLKGFPKALRKLLFRMRISRKSAAELISEAGVLPKLCKADAVQRWTQGKHPPPVQIRKEILRKLKEKEQELRPLLNRICDNIRWAENKRFSLAGVCENIKVSVGSIRQAFADKPFARWQGLDLGIITKLDRELVSFRERYANLEPFSASRLKALRRAAGLTTGELTKLVIEKLANQRPELTTMNISGILGVYENTQNDKLALRPELWEIILECLQEHPAELVHKTRQALRRLCDMGYGLLHIARQAGLCRAVLYGFANAKNELHPERVRKIHDLLFGEKGSLHIAQSVAEPPSKFKQLRLAAGLSLKAIAAAMRDAGFPRGKASLWCIENKWWAKRNNYSPHSVAGRFSPEEWAYVVSVCNHYAALVRNIRERYRKASVSVGIAKELTRRVKLKSQGRATISLTRLVRFLSGTAGIMPYQIEAVDSALKELEQEAPWLPLVNLQWLKTRLRELGVSLPKACESLGCRLYGKSNRRVLSLWFFNSARRWTFEQAKAVWDLYGSPELLPQPSQATSATGNGNAEAVPQVAANTLDKPGGRGKMLQERSALYDFVTVTLGLRPLVKFELSDIPHGRRRELVRRLCCLNELLPEGEQVTLGTWSDRLLFLARQLRREHFRRKVAASRKSSQV